MSSHSWGRSSRLYSGSNIISNSHPFRSMSISPPIPEIWLFENLTLKIQVQGHGWSQRSRSQGQGHSSKSHSWSNIPLTHILHIPCQLTSHSQGQDHGWGQSSNSQSGSDFLSNHMPFVPCQSAMPFIGYIFSKIWSCKSKVKVIVQGHIVGPTSYQLTSLSFHVNQPSHSWHAAISKYDLENPRLRSLVRWKIQVTQLA